MLHGWLVFVILVSTCKLVRCQPTPGSQRSELVISTSPAASKWATVLTNQYISSNVDRQIRSVGILENIEGDTSLEQLMERDQIDFHIYGIDPIIPHDFPPDKAILPIALSPIAIAVNLPHIPSMCLSMDTLLSIFNGTCLTWNHSLIQGDNPSLILPSEPITVIKRNDSAATTDALASLFLKSSSHWAMRYGSKLPSLQNQVLASGIEGVINEAIRRPYSLTYAVSHALTSTSLTVAYIKNHYGLLVSIADVPDVKLFPDSNHVPELVEIPSPHYPLAVAIIIQMPRTSLHLDTAVRRSRFLLWIIEKFLTKTDNVADEYGLVPLIEANRDMLMLDKVQVRDHPEQRALQTVLETRSCLIGQTRSETSSPAFYVDILNHALPDSKPPYIDNTCLPCPPGTYNIDSHSATCSQCPRQAFCPGGKSLLVPKGSWAYVYFANDTTSVWVVTCERNLRSCCPDDQCLVEPRPGSSTKCSALLTGPGCSRCTEGYMPWLRTCFSCDMSEWVAAAQVVGFVVLCVVTSLCTMLAPQMSEIIYIETLLFHVQISIRLLQKLSSWSKMERIWPRDALVYLATIQTFDDVSLFMFPGLSCPFRSSLAAAESLALGIGIIYFATPKLLITLLGPFWLNSRKKMLTVREKSNSSADVGVFVDPDRDRDFLKTIALNGTFRLISISMTPILYRSLSAMKCDTNPINGTQVLSSVLSEECWTDDHRNLYVLACFIIFTLVVVFPWALNREMTKAEHILNAHDPAYNMMSHMKKRYRVYRPAIVAIDHILEKFVVVCALVFASQEPSALIFTFGLFLLIRISFTFYSRHFDNVLRITSIMSLATISVILPIGEFGGNLYYASLMCLLLVILCPLICIGAGVGEWLNRRKVQNKIVPVIKKRLAAYSSAKAPATRAKHFAIVTQSNASRKSPTSS